MKYFFILGAKDPEMQKVEEILVEEGLPFEHAKGEDGYTVLPHTAYEAVIPRVPSGHTPVFVECAPKEGVPGGAVVIDHHRPGDPGFGMPPEKFWEASSVGQVCHLIGADDLRNDTEVRAIAAADHCLWAAYAGRCPDVAPEDVLDIRARDKARFESSRGKKITPEDIKSSIASAIEAIRAAPRFDLGDGITAADCRAGAIPHLNEAAAISGETVMYRLPATKKTPEKEGVFSPDPRAIKAWMKLAEKRGFKKVWGDPARGFAGGFPK